LVHDHNRDRFPVGSVMHRDAGSASQSVLIIIGGIAIDCRVKIRIVTSDRISAVTGTRRKDKIGVKGADTGIGCWRIRGAIFRSGDDLGAKRR